MNPLSGVLGEAWTLYKRHAAHFLVIAFVIYLAAAILVGVLSLAGAIGSFLGVIIALIAGFLVQAALVKAVQDVRDGRVDLNLGETVSAVLPYLLTVTAASIPAWP
jgi:F0F1-type ATP synthase assembly protein I